MCFRTAPRFLLFAALTVSLTATGGGSSYCPDEHSRPASSFVKELDDVCYEFHLERVTWEDASASCKRRRGSLATVDSRAKQDFLAGILQPDRAFSLVWIGAKHTRARGKWTWENKGEELSYTNWATHNSKNINDNSCCSMGREDGWQWQSVYCASSMFLHSYICQYDSQSASGLLSEPGNVIGLAVGLSAAFCVLIAIISTLACIRRRRRMRADRRRSFSSDSAEQKISNIEGGYNKYDINTLNALNICPAPPAYGQVTTLQATDADEPLSSTAAQPLLYGVQQQTELCNNDLLSSNLASHSSQASKLQDKCLSELIAADQSGTFAATRAADDAVATDDAVAIQQPAIVVVAVDLIDGGQVVSATRQLSVTADQLAAAEAADGENQEARALLQSNDLS